MLLGSHVPTTGGYEKMVDYALSVGCECIQMFAKSPRQWNSKAIDPAAADLLKSLRIERGLGPVLTHTAYLINLSTDNDELREKSIAALADEIGRATLLGADGVNTHIGNDPSANSWAAARRAADSILRAYEMIGGPENNTRLILENSAGAGTSFGDTVEQLAEVVDKTGLPVENIGICIDTCHAWAAGYDVGSVEGWDELVRQVESRMEIERFAWIHANDCLFGRGLKKDRHAWIGEGEIGIDGFAAMVSHPKLSHINVVTEMPGEMPEKDVVNIERLKALRDA